MAGSITPSIIDVVLFVLNREGLPSLKLFSHMDEGYGFNYLTVERVDLISHVLKDRLQDAHTLREGRRVCRCELFY